MMTMMMNQCYFVGINCCFGVSRQRPCDSQSVPRGPARGGVDESATAILITNTNRSHHQASLCFGSSLCTLLSSE